MRSNMLWKTLCLVCLASLTVIESAEGTNAAKHCRKQRCRSCLFTSCDKYRQPCRPLPIVRQPVAGEPGNARVDGIGSTLEGAWNIVTYLRGGSEIRMMKGGMLLVRGKKVSITDSTNYAIASSLPLTAAKESDKAAFYMMTMGDKQGYFQLGNQSLAICLGPAGGIPPADVVGDSKDLLASAMKFGQADSDVVYMLLKRQE